MDPNTITLAQLGSYRGMAAVGGYTVTKIKRNYEELRRRNSDARRQEHL